MNIITWIHILFHCFTFSVAWLSNQIFTFNICCFTHALLVLFRYSSDHIEEYFVLTSRVKNGDFHCLLKPASIREDVPISHTSCTKSSKLTSKLSRWVYADSDYNGLSSWIILSFSYWHWSRTWIKFLGTVHLSLADLARFCSNFFFKPVDSKFLPCNLSIIVKIIYSLIMTDPDGQPWLKFDCRKLSNIQHPVCKKSNRLLSHINQYYYCLVVQLTVTEIQQVSMYGLRGWSGSKMVKSWRVL